MGNKDILTLQIGNFSNFVGSHFWNSLNKKTSALNDRIDQEVFFNSNNCVSTPRLIAIDLAGSLGSRSVENQDQIEPQLWEGVQEVYKTELTAAKDCTQYEQEDCVWSDFLEVPLHARSINILPEFYHNNDADPFDIFPMGVSCWNNEEIRDSLENNTRSHIFIWHASAFNIKRFKLYRLYAEHSDCLQGFQIVLDASNAFGGLASQFLQHLNEEYSNKTTMCFPLFHSTKNLDKWSKEQLINTGLVIDSQFENSSMFSPLSLYSSWNSTKTRQFNHINLKPFLPYHASSIIATALETILLPLQEKGSSTLYMRDLTNHLVEYGRKAVGVSCAIPLSNMAFTDLISLKLAATQFVSLFPGSEVCQNSWKQNLIWRGVQDPDKCQALIEQWLSPSASSITTNTLFNSPCSAEIPFPQFFIDSLKKEQIFREDGMDFLTYGGLHSSPLIGDSLKSLSNEIAKIKVKQLHRFLSMGMEEDDLLENRSRLIEFSDNY